MIVKYISEHSLLGQQSRARRVRSAHIRNNRRESITSSTDIHKLNAIKYPDLDTSSNTSSLEYNANPNPSSFAPPVYQPRSSTERTALFQKHEQPKQRPKTARVNRYELTKTIHFLKKSIHCFE